MKMEMVKIIASFIELSDEYEEEGIHEAISSLAQNWPNLTSDEKREILAVAQAYKIATIDEEDDTESYEENFGELNYNTYVDNNIREDNQSGFFGKIFR